MNVLHSVKNDLAVSKVVCHVSNLQNNDNPQLPNRFVYQTSCMVTLDWQCVHKTSLSLISLPWPMSVKDLLGGIVTRFMRETWKC